MKVLLNVVLRMQLIKKKKKKESTGTDKNVFKANVF